MTGKIYKGPVCYVGHDHEAADGRPLESGWHYTVINDGEGDSMPGEKLVHDPETDKYHFATEDDRSHADSYQERLAEMETT